MFFSDDFRQVLPVVPNGTRPQIVVQCVNRSSSWSHARTLRLTINMRVRHHQSQGQYATELQQFADYLLRTGDGREPTTDESSIRIS